MKSSYICILFVFVTIIASAQSTTCSKCWNVGDTECCGDQTIECPGSQCMTISEQCTLDCKEYRTIRKTCGDPMTCDMCFSVTTNQGVTVKASTRCSTGDNSNDDLEYKITCDSLEEKNGYECPACFRNDSMDGCEATETVKCGGAETECLTYKGEVQFSDGTTQKMSLQGCIVKNGCQFGFSALPGAKEIKQDTFACTPAEKAE